MAKSSPGVGRNDVDPPPPETYLRALGMVTLMAEEKKKMGERHKRLRKTIEGYGVALGDVDEMFRMKDSSEEEMISWFKRKAASFGALFSGITEQFDIFAPKPNPTDRKLAFAHIGKMSGLKGEPAKAPPNLAGADLTDWLAGHAEGARARDQANADFLAAALDNAEKGVVTDGTGKPKTKAEKVGEQAKADFKADNPDVKLPGETPAKQTAAPKLPGEKSTPPKRESQSDKAARIAKEAGTV